MNVMILGGTGMLGYAAAMEFLAHGHQVEATARRARSFGTAFDTGVKLRLVDISEQTPEQLVALFQGQDAVVYALGPDDREAPPAPAAAFFDKYLVEQTERVAQAARQAGVKKLVVLGSYFCTVVRQHPDWPLAEHHPYIAARLRQERQAIAAGQAGVMDVCMLEIPYVFGPTPGQVTFFKELLFERIRKMPVVMYPKGGSLMTTTEQVARATLGAVLHGEHGGRYPVGEVNMDWNEMLRHILTGLGQRKTIVNVPMFLSQMNVNGELKKQSNEGREAGLAIRYLMPDVLYRQFYVDTTESRQKLDYGHTDVPAALTEMVRDAYR